MFLLSSVLHVIDSDLIQVAYMPQGVIPEYKSKHRGYGPKYK